jgi:hypothetical protein
MDEVDFTILAATSVFTDFMDKCPPAEACRDAFDRTVKATLKMVNASGGFGPHAAVSSNSRPSLDHNRFNWNTRNDNAPMLNKPHHKRHFRNSASVDQTPNPLSDAYSNNPSLLSAFQRGAQYRLPSGPAVKVEQDGYTHIRNLSVPPRINASPTDNATSPLTPEAAAATVDQQMMPSPAAIQQRPTPPTAQQLSSPMAELVNQTPPAGFLSPRQRQQQQQQQQQQFSPGAMSFSELQGMEFLQNLSPNAANNGSDSGAGAAGGGGGIGGASNTGGLDGVDFSGLADTHMDLGFGLGWEGLHHDFNDGQQLDLFDGFFFGGGPQQGGGGGVGGGI